MPPKRLWAMGLLVVMHCVIAVPTQAAQDADPLPTVADWRHDIMALVDDLHLLHPNPFTRRGPLAFQRDVAALLDAIPRLTDEQRLVGAMRLVASLGDGHTLLEPVHARYGRWYPIRIQEFTDGYYVVTAHQSVADLAGAQVLAIAGAPIDEVADAARALIGADNPSAAKERVWALHNAAMMRGLGYAAASGDLSVQFRFADGHVEDRTLMARAADHPTFAGNEATFEWHYRPEVYGLPIGTDDEWISAFRALRTTDFRTADTTRPVYLTDRRPFSARALPQRDAYYVRMNYVSDSDFIPFVRRVLAEVDRQRPRHLIIDWRQNFGGDGSKLAYLTREFVKRADDQPWGELYVLTGPTTFSAAIMALHAVLGHAPATVIGEPSAAAFNHFGDPEWRTYSRTGIRLSVSTRWWQLSSSDDLRQWVPVDVPAPFSFADFVAGRDPAVDPILRGDDMRSIPAIAAADGGDSASVVYRARREAFGRYAWWGPPEEFALREACDQLEEEDRTADALATCRLNADLHPYIWNVWYNLAAAQRAAGLMTERLASYRCVIAIAPDNWNVPAIRELLAQPGNEGSELAPGCPARTMASEP